MQFISLFLNVTEVADFLWKMLMSAELKGCVTWAIYFFSHNCAKFHHYKVCVTDFREREPFWAPIREHFQKRSSWIGLRPNEICFHEFSVEIFWKLFYLNFLWLNFLSCLHYSISQTTNRMIGWLLLIGKIVLGFISKSHLNFVWNWSNYLTSIFSENIRKP